MSEDSNAGLADRSRRPRTLLRGLLHRQDLPDPIEIRIRNLSSGGLMANCAETIETGTRVSVTIREIGDIAGVVVWSENDGVGIAFDEAIDPNQPFQPARPRAAPLFVPAVSHGKRPGLRRPR